MLSEIREELAEQHLELDDLREAVTGLRAADPAQSGAEEIDPKLAAAMAAGHPDGKGLVLDVGEEKFIVVVGDEGKDPAVVQRFLRQAAS